MNIFEAQAANNTIESAKTRVCNLFTQCLKDIEKTAMTSGLTLRDVGVDVEKYASVGNSYIVEFRMKI